jgi:hypothetical protein
MAARNSNRAATASDWGSKKGGRGTARSTRAKQRRKRVKALDSRWREVT